MKHSLVPSRFKRSTMSESGAASRHENIHANDQLLTVFNSLSVGMLSLDKKGIIRLYNAALANLLDTNKSLIGEKANTVFHLVNNDNKPVELMDLVAGLGAGLGGRDAYRGGPMGSTGGCQET